ncbi:TonB-dependent receptor plug domain-containing protein [Arcicella sp. DC2W]|uniref:TonB-dependent receptor plug domain-containing protein n=1 Tax=Arcicella gelida TaxID=2984195 RepID=A0ABU5S1K0_9BACT|nr:TonB-dependent receptor plug domain-containing protein [Arcicella sp. DC2W]MEA5402358.1 TonB-dependent receptor plug domain-containing protein [Arcicella sp. DC2W]
MKTIFLLLIPILSLLHFNSFAQEANKQHFLTIKVMIRDSSDNSLLKDAIIKVDFQKVHSSSDSSGIHTLFLRKGNYALSITHLGYRTFNLKLLVNNKNINLNVGLVNVARELDEVVVNSQGGNNNVARPLLGVNPLSMKMIKRIPAMMGETDILRSLQMLPGVTSVGEAANGVNIRGGTTDQNLILLDDTPIFNPTHLFGLFSIFPPDAVAGLDLYKGGIPARFGGRASSVIDIYMINPSLEKFKMTGGVSLVSNRLTIEQPLVKDKLGIMVSGRASFNDFLFKLGPPRLENIKANFYDLATKVYYKINTKNTLSLSGYLSKDFFQTDLLGTIANVNASATQYDYRTFNTSMKWFHAFNTKLNLQTVAVYTHYQPQTLLPELNSNNKVSIASGIRYHQLKSSLSYSIGEHRIEMGIGTILYNINPGTLNPGTSKSVNFKSAPEEKSIESSVHIEDEYMLNKRFNLSLGLRYSKYWAMGPSTVRDYDPSLPKSDFSVIDSTVYQSGQSSANYGGFEPRLALKYAINEISSIKLGYSLMRQYLQVVSNTTTPLPTSRWATSNKYIKPQVSQLLSVGYFKNSKDNVYEFSIEAYHRTTENIIDFKPGADFLFQPYIETQTLQGKGNAYGIELMLSKKKGAATGWINYTYSRALNQIKVGERFEEQINNGKWYATNFDRPHSLNATISIAQGKHHEFGFTFVYNTGRPFTIPDGFVLFNNVKYPFYKDRNNDRIKDYHRLDFSWTIHNPTLNKKRWEGSWTFTVYNLYARANAYSVYLKAENGLRAYQLTIFGSAIPSLTYNFKFM